VPSILVSENNDLLTRLVSEHGSGAGLQTEARTSSDARVRAEVSLRRTWSARLDERTRWFPKGSVTGGPVVADVTGDGVPDVSVGCLAGLLLVLDEATGETVSVRRFGARSGGAHARARSLPDGLSQAVEGSGEPVNGITAAELDGRPGKELVFGCSNRIVYAYAPSRGDLLWTFETGGKVQDPPIALDWNADGCMDVIVWDDESVHLLDGRTGRLLPGFPVLRRPDSVSSCDLDGDGSPEIVCVERGAARVAVWRVPGYVESSGKGGSR
jgi:outer membrane protein assembly factor BamB